MKYIWMGFLWFFIPFISVGQYLDTLHETPTQHEVTFCYNWDHTHLSSVSSLSDSNWTLYGWNYLQFKQYDDQFNVINEVRYQDSNYVYYPWRQLHFFKDNYYLCGYKNKVFDGDSSIGYLVKYDTLGKVLWEKTYYPNVEEVRINWLQSRGDFIYMCGTHYYPSSTNVLETSLSKIDTAGNLIWTKMFTGSSQQPISFRNTSDSGFVLATTYQPAGSNLKTIVYKLDSLGDVKWQRILGYTPSQFEPATEHILTSTEMIDGNYLCFGGSQHPTNSTYRSWLVKLNPMGTVLIDTVYDFSTGYDVFNNVSNIIYKTDGFYVLRSFYESISTNYSLSGIAFYDYDLNLQWTKQYEHRQAENAIMYQKKLDNGFIALADYCFQDAPNNTADEWFMVVDSMGCLVQNCSVGIEEKERGLMEIKVYPNPFDDHFTIKLSDSDNLSSYSLKMYNLLGQEVLTKSFHSTEVFVSVKELPVGIYTMCLLNNRRLLHAGKIMKE